MPIYAPNGSIAYVAPTPSEELEGGVRRILKQIDELLDIRWINNVAFSSNPSAERMEGRYALTMTWPIGDRNWKEYQEGKTDQTWDILGWLCTDMNDATSVPTSLDGIEDRVIEIIGKCDGRRYPWKDKMKNVMEKNRLHRQRMKDDALDEAEEKFKYYRKHVFHEPIIQAGIDLKKGQ